MSRLTECCSMYSDMSMRTIALVSSNRKPASARASSVLPTPVGPRKTNEPMGRLGSDSPVRLRRMALATAATASSCPTTDSWRCSSRRTSLWTSPSISLTTGIPVHRLTTSATSSSPTSSLSIAPSDLELGQGLVVLGQLGVELGQGAVAELGGALQVATALGSLGFPAGVLDGLLGATDGVDLVTSRAASGPRSACSSSSTSASCCSTASRRSTEPRSLSLARALCSISSWRRRRSSSSISSGIESISMRRREAASSIRSIALSGRKRAVM